MYHKVFNLSVCHRITTIILLMALSFVAGAKDNIYHIRYSVDDGLPHRRITCMAQDSVGYIWIATHNGLCRFDGEQFIDCSNTSSGINVGRIDHMGMTTKQQVWLIRESDGQEFVLNQQTMLLEPVNDFEKELIPVDSLLEENYVDSLGLHITHQSQQYLIPYEVTQHNSNRGYLSMFDRQGNLWANFDDALYQISFSPSPFEHITKIDPFAENNCSFGDEIRSLLHLRDGGFLLACRNKCIYKYSSDFHFEGYLTASGKISRQKECFGAVPYVMRQDKTGRIWIGTHEDGLFVVRSQQVDSALRKLNVNDIIRHYEQPFLQCNNINEILFMPSDQIMISTWAEGIQKFQESEDGQLTTVATNFEPYKLRKALRISNNLYALCTKKGLFFVNSDLKTISKVGTIDFTHLLQAPDGTWYLSSASNGVFTFTMPQNPTEDDLDRITLKPLQLPDLGNSILTMAQDEDGVIRFVSDHSLTRFDTRNGHSLHFDHQRSRSNITFGMADPLCFGSTIIFGTTAGYIVIQNTTGEGYKPRIVLDAPDRVSYNWMSTPPTIRPTALDYRLPRIIQYGWRCLPDTTWNGIGRGEPITLPSLWPGEYKLQIFSTDSRGIWSDQPKEVRIHVGLSQWFIAQALLFVGIVALIIFLVRKARHPKVLLEHDVPIISGIQPAKPLVEERDLQFVEQVTSIVEKNISDPDLGVDMLAAEMNHSRTILYTRFKETLNATPAAFINDIRMKRAIQLLDAGQHRVSEIANLCGYTDAKYFARIFKQKVGITPAKYQEQAARKE